MKLVKSFFAQIVVASILGLIIGLLWPTLGAQLQLLSTYYIKLLKMIIPFIVFTIIVTGITQNRDLPKTGHVAVKAVIYLALITLFTTLIGGGAAILLHPGVGMNLNIATLDPKVLDPFLTTAHQISDHGLKDFFNSLLPTTLLSGFISGNIFQIALVATLTGCALVVLGKKTEGLINVIENLNGLLFQIRNFIMRLTPLAVLGAIAFSVGLFGISLFRNMVMFIASFYLCAMLFAVIVLGIIMRFSGFRIFTLIDYLKDELIVSSLTHSPDSVILQLLAKLQNLRIGTTSVGTIISFGYLNDGALSLYVAFAVIFIAQATNTPLSWPQIIGILTISYFTTKGSYGMPYGIFIALTTTLQAIPAIPLVGLVILLSIHWLIAYITSPVSVLANAVVTIAVANWSKDIDKEAAKSIMKRKVVYDYRGMKKSAP